MQNQGNNYPNPLDNFRTYSYHFVMTAASSTEAFRNLIGGNEGQPSPLLGAISTVGLGEEVRIGDSSAYLVLDTRRFSQYSVTDVEMEHMFGTGTLSNPTVPSSTMKMKLVDSTGISFFDFMMDLMRNKLQTTRASAFFLLSIIFVGHRDDGTTETISTCHIPLTLLFMSFELDSSGSTYDIEFMELEGAPQNGKSMEHINYLGDLSSVSTIGRDKTIGGLLDSLEDQLNAQSIAFYKKYHNAENEDNSKTKPGKLVQYMITAPEEWRAFNPNLASSSVTQEQVFQANSNVTKNAVSYHPVGDRQIPFSPTSPITNVIKNILESSNEFLKLSSAEKRRSGQAQAFKTITTITSDESTYVIHFDVYQYYMPKIAKDVTQNNQVTKRPVTGSAEIVQNVISYDYMFSGRNSHIKSLQIKYDPESSIALDTDLQLGKQRAAQVANVGQTTKAVESVSTGAKSTTEFAKNIRRGDPIFMPIKTAEQRKNNSAQYVEGLSTDEAKDTFKSKQEYNQTYAFLHFVSSMLIEMQVRGNPNIIRKFADRNERGGMAPHTQIISSRQLKEQINLSNLVDTVGKSVQTSKANYIQQFVKPRMEFAKKGTDANDSLLNNIDVSTLPVFVKLNIQAPNVDHLGNYMPGESMFTDRFFFNGPYQMLVVKTTFSGGDFEHSMTLIPYQISEDNNDQTN